MKDLLAGPIFKVGDIIQSKYDRPKVITKVKNLNGWIHYESLRLDPEDIRINGPTCNYSHLSVAMFEVVGFNPAIATLFS